MLWHPDRSRLEDPGKFELPTPQGQTLHLVHRQRPRQLQGQLPPLVPFCGPILGVADQGGEMCDRGCRKFMYAYFCTMYVHGWLC